MSSPGQGKGKNKRKGKGRGRGRGRGQDLPSNPGRTEHVGKALEEDRKTTEEEPGCINRTDLTADFDEKPAAGACGNSTNGTVVDKVGQEEIFPSASGETTTVEEHSQRGSSSGETPSKSKKTKGKQRGTQSSPPDDKGKGTFSQTEVC